MAGDSHNKILADDDPEPSTLNLTITQLRELAQSHLRRIEIEDENDAETQLQTQVVLQKYTKMKRKDRQRSKSPSQAALATSVSMAAASAGIVGDAEMTKGPKLRSAGDVLDRLKWDPSVRMDEYFIGYLERFDGILEMPAVNWIKESTDEDFIPQHRIRWVKKRHEGTEEVVWDRELRIDKIFGSGPHGVADTSGLEVESVADSIDGGAPI